MKRRSFFGLLASLGVSLLAPRLLAPARAAPTSLHTLAPPPCESSAEVPLGPARAPTMRALVVRGRWGPGGQPTPESCGS